MPTLVYPARGSAELAIGAPLLSEELGALIGDTRARLLQMLAEGASTTHLARQLNMSAGTIGGHVAVLPRRRPNCPRSRRPVGTLLAHTARRRGRRRDAAHHGRPRRAEQDLIRSSFRYAAKQQKLAKDLRPVYTAPPAE
jgi:hypothetical protein